MNLTVLQKSCMRISYLCAVCGLCDKSFDRVSFRSETNLYTGTQVRFVVTCGHVCFKMSQLTGSLRIIYIHTNLSSGYGILLSDVCKVPCDGSHRVGWMHILLHSTPVLILNSYSESLSRYSNSLGYQYVPIYSCFRNKLITNIWM